MLRSGFCGCLLTLALSSAAVAQEERAEVAGFLGYTLSEGIDIDPVNLGGSVFDNLSPTSSFSYGFSFDVFVTENAQIGFQWDRQDSTLKASGPVDSAELADLSVDNYHGIFTYNWGEAGSQARPFLFGGLGATSFSPGEIQGNEIEGETRFSTTWGGGVKFYPGRNVGVKLLGRWTPTYIKSDPAGIWCSPYWPWGCYVVSETDYANQLEFAAGVTFRF